MAEGLRWPTSRYYVQEHFAAPPEAGEQEVVRAAAVAMIFAPAKAVFEQVVLHETPAFLMDALTSPPTGTPSCLAVLCLARWLEPCSEFCLE